MKLRYRGNTADLFAFDGHYLFVECNGGQYDCREYLPQGEHKYVPTDTAKADEGFLDHLTPVEDREVVEDVFWIEYVCLLETSPALRPVISIDTVNEEVIHTERFDMKDTVPNWIEAVEAYYEKSNMPEPLENDISTFILKMLKYISVYGSEFRSVMLHQNFMEGDSFYTVRIEA